MFEEPASDLTPDKAEEMILNIKTENDLARLYADVDNKAWWIEDDLYDFEPETEDYMEIKVKVDFWFNVSDKLRKMIFTILKSEGIIIPQKGYIAVLEPFMERNGFINGNGWWIKI